MFHPSGVTGTCKCAFRHRADESVLSIAGAATRRQTVWYSVEGGVSVYSCRPLSCALHQRVTTRFLLCGCGAHTTERHPVCPCTARSACTSPLKSYWTTLYSSTPVHRADPLLQLRLEPLQRRKALPQTGVGHPEHHVILSLNTGASERQRRKICHRFPLHE